MSKRNEPREARRAGRAIRERLNYANVVATLALFGVVAGGGAWAASKIGPDDIKKNAVRTKHIKNGQVKAADLADPEAFHVVGTQGEPAFGNGGENDCLWGNSEFVSPDSNPASFFKDADGIVHLAGVPAALNGPGGDATCDAPAGDFSDLLIFRLPAGYRPSHLEIFPSANSNIGLNQIAPADGVTIGGEFIPGGSVFANAISAGNATTLDGFTFRAAGPAAGGLGGKEPAKISLKEVRALLD